MQRSRHDALFRCDGFIVCIDWYHLGYLMLLLLVRVASVAGVDIACAIVGLVGEHTQVC
jgi:hypothetical protein